MKTAVEETKKNESTKKKKNEHSFVFKLSSKDH